MKNTAASSINLKLLIIFIGLFYTMTTAAIEENRNINHCVILLHGLNRTAKSMAIMERALTQAGYHVENVDYPSTQHTIAATVQLIIPNAFKKCPANSRIHFVTHSLGGILLRQYLHNTNIPNLSYSVMLGPPNKGSEIIDKLGNLPGFNWLNGPAGAELGTLSTSTPNTLGKANFDVGIIAGNKSINLILSLFIPGDDDGKVSIKNTTLDGMLDHIVLPVSHPFMMKNKVAIRQTLYFLQNGQFQRQSI